MPSKPRHKKDGWSTYSRNGHAGSHHPRSVAMESLRGMTGPQKTRIDGILANRAAKVLVQKAELKWTRSLGFDHVCMALQFNVEMCTQQVWRIRQPIAIDLPSLVYGTKKG